MCPSFSPLRCGSAGGWPREGPLRRPDRRNGSESSRDATTRTGRKSLYYLWLLSECHWRAHFMARYLIQRFRPIESESETANWYFRARSGSHAWAFFPVNERGPSVPTPAEMLTGRRLDNGWTVTTLLARKPGATGGSFSTGYLVQNDDGRTGFLKAIDYSRAFSVGPIDAVKFLTDTYVFERDICIKCVKSGVTRVVHALDYGQVDVGVGKHPTVNYLIFEKADGDVRAALGASTKLDYIVALKSLHGVALALKQLHNADMAHQDVKPSNVLMFTGQNSKLGDLGRAWSSSAPAPHDGVDFAGDPSYAPLDAQFDPIQDRSQRFAYDLYLLGSLAVFLFTRANMTALLQSHLDPSLRGTFATYAEFFPHLQAAFAKAKADVAVCVPDCIRDDLLQIVEELCDPDPLRRGNPTKTGQQRLSLERYISAFDLFARRVRFI